MLRIQEEMEEKMARKRAEAAAKAAAEQQRIAAAAAQEAAKLDEERKQVIMEAERLAAKIQENEHMLKLISLGTQEVAGELPGIANLQIIFSGNSTIKTQFLATKPLELALLKENLTVVKFLISMNLTYPNWQEIVDEGTPLYEFMSSIAHPNNSNKNTHASNKCKL